MKFDRIVNSYLKENEGEKLVHVQGGDNSGEFGRIFKVPELDKEIVLNKVMTGTPSVIALEIIQWSIDTVKKYGISTPSKIDDIWKNTLYADNLTKPNFLHLTYGWMTSHPEYPRGYAISFYYKIEALKAPHYTPISTNDHPKNIRITLDQLKDICEKDITDKAMRGHELEDLYDF